MDAWLERNRGLLVIVLSALLAAGVVLLVMRYRHDPPPLELRLDELPQNSEVVVHVAGAVRNPGVYSLAPDARVVDALEAAGGPTDDADLTALNQAKRLHDGEQVIVPATGETDGPLGTGASGKININTASAQLLDSLPGIGEVYSARIVTSRETDGPFQTIDDLLARDLVPRSTFDKIKDLITVGP